jgi:mannosyltransferase
VPKGDVDVNPMEEMTLEDRRSESPSLKAHRWLSNPSLIITLSAAVLYLYRLGSKPLWLDETVSALQASLTWADTWAIATTHNVNMALHYLLLHPWVRLDDSEFWLRLPSALFAIAAVPVVYATARQLFDLRVAAYSAGIFALNPFVLQYAQEARGYSMAMVFAALTSLLLLRFLDQPSNRRLFAWVIVSAVLPYTHFFGLLVLAGHAAASLFVMRRPAVRVRLIGGFAAIGVASVPLLAFVFGGGDSGQADWMEALTPLRLVGLYPRLVANDNVVLALVVLVMIGAALRSAYLEAKRFGWASSATWTYVFVFSCVLLPIALGAAISLFKPMFVARFFIVIVPPLSIVVGRGLATLAKERVLMMLVGLFILATAWSMGQWYFDRPKEDWRGAAAIMALGSKPGDGVVMAPHFARVPVEWYAVRNPGHSNIEPLVPGVAWGDYRPGDAAPVIRSADVRLLARDHDRLWSVTRVVTLSQSGVTDQTVLEDGILETHGVAGEWSFEGVRLRLYERSTY